MRSWFDFDNQYDLDEVLDIITLTVFTTLFLQSIIVTGNFRDNTITIGYQCSRNRTRPASGISCDKMKRGFFFFFAIHDDMVKPLKTLVLKLWWKGGLLTCAWIQQARSIVANYKEIMNSVSHQVGGDWCMDFKEPTPPIGWADVAGSRLKRRTPYWNTIHGVDKLAIVMSISWFLRRSPL